MAPPHFFRDFRLPQALVTFLIKPPRMSISMSCFRKLRLSRNHRRCHPSLSFPLMMIAVGKLYILGEVMRLESVYKVILNVKVIPSLKPTTEGKFVRFLAFENEASPSTFTFRTSSADVARSLVEEMLSAN
ncbi:hypothetical protein L0F63_003377 [Massospora cicadina]|nr:hypothetical protein L0F63_003377 [Massospora cicadina]